MDAPFRIRPATADDLAAILEIERASFTDPWSPEGLRETISSRATIPLLAETERTVVGYTIARTVTDQAEILTLGVRPGDRRRGVGRALVTELLERLREDGIQEVWLEVRVSNHPAQALYRSFGFFPGGMRRAYYRHPKEDALVYRLALAPPRA